MNAPLLHVDRLHAGYRRVRVVRDLSLTVGAGEVVSLLGPNGAGKTTTLLTIAAVLSPLGGHIDVLGRSTHHTDAHMIARRGLALVPADRGLFAQLSVAENLRLAGRGRRDSHTDAVLAALPALTPLWKRKVALLSGGEQQMLALASALVRRPKLLLIDEMSLGLAPQLVERLLRVVRELADQEGAGVLIVEQHARLALALADSAVILRHGEVVMSGSAAELRARSEQLESSYLSDAALADPLATQQNDEGTNTSGKERT